MGPLQEYVGVTVERPSQGEVLLSQPDIIARLERYFGKEVSSMRVFT